MKSLSVVCAYRDASKYLPDLLRSLGRTALPDAEVIFIDDASIDSSLDVIDDLTREVGAEISVIENRVPRGPAYCRNLGMDAASGELLAFVDGDDWVGPTYFTELRKWIETLDVDFIRCDHVKVSGRKRHLGRAPDARYHVALDPSSAVLPADEATMVDFPYTHSGIFHRRLLDGGVLKMPSELRTAEDRPWIWRLHLEAESYARIESLQYFYRRDVATSLTQVGDDRQLDFIPSLSQVLDYVNSDEKFIQYRTKAYRQCLSVVDLHLSKADRLSDGLEHQMRLRIPDLLARIPDQELTSAFRQIGRTRGDRIRNVELRLHGL